MSGSAKPGHVTNLGMLSIAAGSRRLSIVAGLAVWGRRAQLEEVRRGDSGAFRSEPENAPDSHLPVPPSRCLEPVTFSPARVSNLTERPEAGDAQELID